MKKVDLKKGNEKSREEKRRYIDRISTRECSGWGVNSAHVIRFSERSVNPAQVTNENGVDPGNVTSESEQDVNKNTSSSKECVNFASDIVA